MKRSEVWSFWSHLLNVDPYKPYLQQDDHNHMFQMKKNRSHSMRFMLLTELTVGLLCAVVGIGQWVPLEGKSQCQTVESGVSTAQYSPQTWTPCLEHSTKFSTSFQLIWMSALTSEMGRLRSHLYHSLTLPHPNTGLHSPWMSASKWHFVCHQIA